MSIFFGVAVCPASAQSPAPQRLYVSEPAIQGTSLVGGFNQTAQTGALSEIPSSPFNERLEGGLVAVDGLGKFVFVLNPTSDDISMFQIDQASGALSEVPGSPFAAPPVSPDVPSLPTDPMSMVAEPSGKFLYVGYLFAVGHTQTYSSVIIFAIDTSGASPVLRVIRNSSSGSPLKLLTDSKGLHLYTALGIGADGSELESGPEVAAIDPATGLLTGQGIAPNPQNRAIDMAIDPKDRFIYTLGGLYSGSSVTGCTISPVDGSITTCPSGASLYPSGAAGMVVDSSGHFLYIQQVYSGVGQFVAYVFAIDQTTGTLTQVGTTTAYLLHSVADPTGPYIYAPGNSYQVDLQTGNLSAIPGSQIAGGSGLTLTGNLSQAVSGPAVTIFPATAATFNATAGTSSVAQAFSIVNTGNQLLSFSSISIAGANASSFSQTNTCLATLAPNANCSVSITFNPTSAGAFAANFQIADNAPGSPQSLVLNGTASAAAPAVTFSPSAGPSFPTTTEGTASVAQTLMVLSTGNAPLHVSSVSLGGPNPSDFSFTNNCTAPVPPGSNCTISLVFSPLAPGQRTANLSIADDVAGSPQTVALSATANVAATGGPASGGMVTASVSAGQAAHYQLQLTPGPGFSGTVSLTCSGAPVGAVCQVPASVVLANGVATPFAVTVTTSGPAVALLPLSGFKFRTIPFAALLPFLALPLLILMYGGKIRAFGCESARHHLTLRRVLAASVFFLILDVSGCGGGSNGSVTPPPVITPSGTSTITITPSAKSSSGQPLQLQAIQLTLTVK